MTVTVRSLASYLTWNHDIGGVGFTHSYREAPDLGMFHSSVSVADTRRIQQLEAAVLSVADQPSYVVGQQTITATTTLRWMQLRLEHGAIVRFEAVVTTTFSNGQTSNQHVEVVPDLATQSWAKALHGAVYATLGLDPPP